MIHGRPVWVELLCGDASDAAFARRACAGASVVYQCLNPAYHRWAEEFPGLQAGVLAGAEAAGARLVAMENVYAYGPPLGRPLTEDRPLEAQTRKGRVRARMTEELFAANGAGRVPVAAARASDYFGPGGGPQSMIGDRVIPPALAGRAASVVGDPDQPHSYTFIPDIAETLAVLGERDEALGEAWHVPNAPARTTREVVDLVFRHAGTRPKLRAAPKPLLWLLGVRDPTVRELRELLYEFEEPFVVDSTKAEQRLGLRATPLEEAVAWTVAHERATTAAPGRTRV